MVRFGVLFYWDFAVLITYGRCGPSVLFPLFLRLFSVAVWLFCLISATAQRCGPSILRSRTVSGCFRAWLPCLRWFRDLMRCGRYGVSTVLISLGYTITAVPFAICIWRNMPILGALVILCYGSLSPLSSFLESGRMVARCHTFPSLSHADGAMVVPCGSVCARSAVFCLVGA